MPTKPRRSVLTPGILLLVIALAVVGYFVLRQGKPLLTGSGCQAGRGAAAVTLDPEQAAIAATIAGVAHQRSMPSHAVMVAYAAALQESAAQPELRRPRLGRGVPAAPVRGLGTGPEAEGPGLRDHQVLPGPGHRARLPPQARLPGRPGRPAQRRRLRLHPVPAGGGRPRDRLHRPQRARGLVLVRGAQPGAGQPGGGPPRAGARVRPDQLAPGGDAGRRPGHDGARTPAGARLGGRVLAGDARFVVRDPRRALRRLPLAGVVREQRVDAGQVPNAPGCGPGQLITWSSGQ